MKTSLLCARLAALLGAAQMFVTPQLQAAAGPAHALGFDGVNDYVDAQIPQALSSNYTFSAWVYIASASANYEPPAAVLSSDCGETAELLVRTVGTNHLLELGRCGSFSGTLSTNGVPLQEWVHLAVTVSPGKQVAYFINGAPAGTWDASALDVTIATYFLLGDNIFRQFNGRLGDVRLWKTSLTRAQITAAMNNSGAVATNHLVLRYQFAEACGNDAVNSAPIPNPQLGNLGNGVTRLMAPAAVAPSAATTAATIHPSTVVTLNGRITPNGTPAYGHFEWGINTSYGQSSGQEFFAGGTQPFVFRVAGLTPGVTYHFRAVATSCAGTNFSADRTFVAPAQVLTNVGFTVTTLADSGAGSLREAVLQANALGGAHPVTFAANLSGKTIRLVSQVGLNSSLTIDASALPGGIRIDGNQAGRIFSVGDGNTVVLDSLTITNGGRNNGSGGGIYNNYQANLTLNRCTVAGNSARYGGGIYNDEESTLTLNQCTVSGNSAAYDGGGIYNDGENTLTLNQCTVSGNSATRDGGGIYNSEESTLTLNQCTLSGNSATEDGGGIYINGNSTVNVNQSTVSGNSAGGNGGGIYDEGDTDLNLYNSIVAGNVKSGAVGILGTGNTDERNALSNTLAGLGFEVRLINDGQWDGLSVVVSYPGEGDSGGHGPDLGQIASGVNYIQISDHGSGWTPNSFEHLDEGTNITVTLDTPHPITSGLPASWVALGFWRYGLSDEDYLGWSTDEGLSSLASETSVANQSRILVANSIGSGKAVYIGWNVYGPDAGTNDVATLRNAILWSGSASEISRDGYDSEGFNFTSGDPRLAPLGNYGGPTPTMPPLAGSPVIDAGAAGTEFTTDQRGFLRFVGNAPDLGAVESTLPCLRAYYSFDNQTAVDETGNSTATHLGECGDDWDTDHFGRANSAAFSYAVGCSNRYLIQTAAHPGNANLDLGLKGSFTVSAWIYPTDTSGDHWVLGNTGPGGNGTLHLGLRNGRAYFGFFGYDFPGQRTIPTNQWTHLAFTYNLQGGIKAIYVNGQLDASVVGQPNNVGDHDLLIGSTLNSGFFLGRIDDLAIYCQTLAPNQVAALASDSVKPDELLPSPDLPLPAPNGCVWSVREIYAHPLDPNDITSAEYIAHTAGLGTFIDYQSDVINFNDPQTNPGNNGFIGGDRPYRSNNLTPTGAEGGGDDNFVLAARTTLVITEEDDYTFGFSSDDGARLRIKGAVFKSSTDLNGANPANPAHRGDTLVFPDPTGNSDTLGVAHLTPGAYEIEFLTWEGCCGAFADVVWARGAWNYFESDAFRLLGYNGPSALTATVTPFVQVITNGAALRTVRFTVQAAGGYGENSYHWFFNGGNVGGNVSGANSPTLTITGATEANAGEYSVFVGNALDATVSHPAFLIFKNNVAPDNQKPSLTITSPAPASLRVLSNSIRLAGTASDNGTLKGVYVATGSGPYQPATGLSNWSLTLPLAPGTNDFRVVAVDEAGNVSTPQTRTVFYSVSNLLTVAVSPGGSVAPNLNGKMLEVGRNYSMRATAAKGYIFSNWTGGVLCSGPVINFPMSPGLALQANFVTNPFTAWAGSYNGLLHETAAVRHDRSGFCSAKVTADGGYSGFVKIDGQRLPISGKFDLGGFATNRLARPGTTALRLELQFDPNGPPQLLGRLTDGQWIANLIADLAPVVPKGTTVPLAGKYTFVWYRNQTDIGVPDGSSVGSIIVSPKSQATILTTFADGAVTTQSVPMPTNGPIPFYTDLYMGKGSALGWLHLNRSAPKGGAVFGLLNWYRPASPGPGLFTNGFEFQANTYGSTYVSPTNNRVLNFTYADLGFGVFRGPEIFRNPLRLGPGGKVVNLATNAMKMSVNLANGLYSGTTVEPGTGRAVQFKGAVFQDYDYGDGWFLTTNSSGWLSLERPDADGAARFDGVNDYVSIATTGSLSGTFTVELWAKPALADRTLALFGSRAGGNNGFDFKFSAGGRIHGDIGDGSSWVTTTADATFAWTSNVWYHIAYVVTPTSYKIYVNGVVAGTDTYAAATPLLYDDNHHLRIGDTGGGDALMNGDIDEVHIWSTARTEAEIKANLVRPFLGNEPGLRGYWNFNTYYNFAPVPDSSGHGFEAIYLNGAHTDYPDPRLPFGL